MSSKEAPWSVEQAWARRVAAMSVVAASGVAVIYVPQPIQTLVAAEFDVPTGGAAAATIAVQAGYALGVVILVSLADRVAPRTQVVAQLLTTALALLASALAPSYAVFVAMSFVAGATATFGQILVATALRLAPESERARTVSVLLGAFLVGLFAVRTALGTVADAVGWRAVVMAAAVVLLMLIMPTLRAVPAESRTSRLGFPVILGSIPSIVRRSGTVRVMSAIHALAFSAFMSVWALSTTFAVTSLGMSVSAAALLGGSGLLAGAITIALARAHRRVGSRRSIATALASLCAGALVLTLSQGVVASVALGLFLVSLGMVTSQVTTQSRAIASVAPAESGRANTIYVATTFFTAAAATTVAGGLFQAGGFLLVSALALVLALAAAALTLHAMRNGTF